MQINIQSSQGRRWNFVSISARSSCNLLRTISVVFSFAVCCIVTSMAEAESVPLTTELVAEGLAYPLYVTHAPGDHDRIFIVQQDGQIRILDISSPTPVLLETPFLDIRSRTTFNNESGLLGLAFHPDYPQNGRFIVNHTNLSDTVIAEYTVSSDPNVANLTESILMKINQPDINHNGGWLAFGPDGYLYVATGDGGSANDPDNRAQDITAELLGKILRIDVDRDDFPKQKLRNYGIPKDNPFVGIDGDNEIWAYGLRNPWRNAFDSLTGDLYIADVGQFLWEEINFQPATSVGGENYGWRCMEAESCTSLTGCTCFDDGLTNPILSYEHLNDPFGCSITGGEVYRGCAIPDLQGTYFYADYCSGRIWSFRYDGSTMTDFTERTVELAPGNGLNIIRISSFGLDASGEMYICDHADGEVFKIVPLDGPIDFQIITSQPPTGAIDARQPSQIDGSGVSGWKTLEMTFDLPSACISETDFSVTQQGGKMPPPQIDTVEILDPNRMRVTFNREVEVGSWTVVTHLASVSSVQIGYLPGDVDGNGESNVQDISTLFEMLDNKRKLLPLWSRDIDRSGIPTPVDILRLIDLLNGAGVYEMYNHQTLP